MDFLIDLFEFKDYQAFEWSWLVLIGTLIFAIILSALALAKEMVANRKFVNDRKRVHGTVQA